MRGVLARPSRGWIRDVELGKVSDERARGVVKTVVAELRRGEARRRTVKCMQKALRVLLRWCRGAVPRNQGMDRGATNHCTRFQQHACSQRVPPASALACSLDSLFVWGFLLKRKHRIFFDVLRCLFALFVLGVLFLLPATPQHSTAQHNPASGGGLQHSVCASSYSLWGSVLQVCSGSSRKSVRARACETPERRAVALGPRRRLARYNMFCCGSFGMFHGRVRAKDPGRAAAGPCVLWGGSGWEERAEGEGRYDVAACRPGWLCLLSLHPPSLVACMLEEATEASSW